jgi:hypothetical protein
MDVSLPQIMTVPLATSGVGPNMLLIMTGTAHMQLPLLGPRSDDNMTRHSFLLDLSDVYGNKMFNPLTTTAVASASLASMKGTSDANEMTWAVDQAFADIQSDFRLRLHADLAVQGSGGLVHRVAYQVFVLTTGLPLLRFITSPASLVIARGASGVFSLIGLVAPDPSGTVPGEPVGFSSEVAGFSLPNTFLATPGATFTLPCTIQPDTLLPGQTQNLSITATTSVNSITAMIRVTQM